MCVLTTPPYAWLKNGDRVQSSTTLSSDRTVNGTRIGE